MEGLGNDNGLGRSEDTGVIDEKNIDITKGIAGMDEFTVGPVR
jgi:hypothetical protein